MKQKMILLCLLTIAAIARANEPFSYSVRHYPLTGADCSETARTLGAQLARATGVKYFGSKGERTYSTYYFCDIEIQYVASDPLRLVSDGYVYASPEECRAALASQLEEFRRNTGVAPFVAYCQEPTIYNTPYAPVVTPWTRLRVDGFGTPRLDSFSLSEDRYGRRTFSEYPTSDPQSALSDIRAHLEKNGAIAKQVFFLSEKSGGVWDTELVVRYYAAKKIPLSFSNLLTFGSAGECLARLPVVKSALASNAKPVTAFCVMGKMYVMLDEADPLRCFRNRLAPSGYPSLAECEADQERMLDIYRKDLGVKAIGALCSKAQTFLEPKGYVMRILEPCLNGG